MPVWVDAPHACLSLARVSGFDLIARHGGSAHSHRSGLGYSHSLWRLFILSSSQHPIPIPIPSHQAGIHPFHS